MGMKGSVRRSMSETGVATSLLPRIAGQDQTYSRDSDPLNDIDNTATVVSQSAGEKGNPKKHAQLVEKKLYFELRARAPKLQDFEDIVVLYSDLNNTHSV